MSGNPSKAEIAQIFKRLRSISANKVCFDCNAKNPTWSSITYGIFICIDCSGIHRSLGVHLTFVRSTQLDSNWTWQQIRQMQLGGNGNAFTFFRLHHVDTSDAQVKYKSRAAQLYRDKLHHAAAQAMRLHGTKLFIDTPHGSMDDCESEALGTKEEQDFFHEHEKEIENGSICNIGSVASSVSKLSEVAADNNENDGPAPNVEAALSMSPTEAQHSLGLRKPTIGQKKPAAKKTGLGGKKSAGLGAQKVKKDFNEVEKEAEQADQARYRINEDRKANETRREEEDAKAAANMRLACQDLSDKQKKQEVKMRNLDASKASQLERLGMGVANVKGGLSHSAMNQMSTIVQEEPLANKSSRGSSRDVDTDFELIGSFSSRALRNNADQKFASAMNDSDDMFEGYGGGLGSSGNWEREFEVLKVTSAPSKSDNVMWKSSSEADSGWSNKFDDQPTNKSRVAASNTFRNDLGDDAQKKFGTAKAISSDMYFGKNEAVGSDADTRRFEGQTSISSAEYFGREELTYAQKHGASFTAPDMEDVKESVRQGVSKVAGRLSNMASGVMTQLQDKYGY